ncbi:hypothetical protein J1605_018934 [Eschrichtius robustus]|uniref:non-specific serine/threonine protein kinase n=1 Tax=Eschrichtius robustus TaxID=9764 RepID=A0AB34HTW7_ESCRO|nr:hypothetical protein J1605_018934 [Eschrichtius robustus]
MIATSSPLQQKIGDIEREALLYQMQLRKLLEEMFHQNKKVNEEKGTAKKARGKPVRLRLLSSCGQANSTAVTNIKVNVRSFCSKNLSLEDVIASDENYVAGLIDYEWCEDISSTARNQCLKETPVKMPVNSAGTEKLITGVISPERRCRSVELNLNQVHVENTPKRKGTKVFGSLEKGLDKVITVLTRSKRKGSAKDGPRRLKPHYNVTTTRLVNPDQLLNEIMSILPKKHVDFVQKGYTLKCQTQSDFGKVTMQFELEVCQLQKPDVVGIRRQRLKGDAWVYKRLVEDILSSCKV